jgi:hypothetical protein
MRTFIINTLNQIPAVNKKLDINSTLKSNEWLVYSDTEGEIEKFLFTDKDVLLVTVNGKTTNSKWQFMKVNSSLLIDDGINQYMFNIIVCCKDIIVLNVDSTNNFSFLINTKSKALHEAKWWDIQCFLMKKYNIDFFNGTEKQTFLEMEKKEAEERDRRASSWKNLISIIVLIAILVFVGKSIVNYSREEKKKQEYKRTHPDMLITRIENRQAVDLGLSVKWAICNIGANKPTEKGNKYGWGDSSGVIYTISTGELISDEDDGFFGYGFPKRHEMEPPTSIVGTGYDVAQQCWGSNWRMPTRSEAQELVDNCEFYIRDNYIVAIGPNGDSILFPISIKEPYINNEYATGELDTSLILKTDRGKTIWSFIIGQEMINDSLVLYEGKPKIYANMNNAFRSDMLVIRAVRDY